MKINNIVTYQNSRPNFKGVYVLNGSAEDVRKVESLIMEKCGHYMNFYDYDYVNLQPIYIDSQPDVKQLIVTNEHSQNARKWRRTKNNQNNSTNKLMRANKFPLRPSRTAHQRIKRLDQKYVLLNNAIKELNNNNNTKPMRDWLDDICKIAESTLQQIKDCAVEPMGKIEVLDAKKVLEAIKNDKFNFITGVIGK